ncbi:MAG: hypothetical protein K2J82_00810 [Muribaculaceae bacterium]|nr:hypothetical protein [Muribaculaceae bacterium]
MKRLFKLLALTLFLGAYLPAAAVTQKEMDQARALATKAYLRYANDGSGYLDNVSPKSMADLEKQLKAKEKENIKAFKSIPVPSGYESWTKEQLVEYWGKAFSSKGLIEKGRAGRTRAKKYISDMTIAPPTKPEEKKEEPKKEEAAPKQEEKPTPDAVNDNAPTLPAVDSMQSTLEKAEAIVEAGIDNTEPDPQINKVKDNSALYIIILVVLVAVVIALVVFASNVMKKNAAAARQNPDAPYPAPAEGESEKMAELREKFSATLTAKNNEIASLSKKLESLNSQNASLKKNLEGLTAEVAVLRNRLSAASASTESRKQASAQAETVRQSAPSPAPTPQAGQPAATPLRTIYLGRVNSKGIFIRADRNLNAGNSVYRLDTTDGFSGSFRVASDPSVWEMAMQKPIETLSEGCTGPDLDNTEGMSRVVNDAAGTAIFENGCWRVYRKAKIHYE